MEFTFAPRSHLAKPTVEIRNKHLKPNFFFDSPQRSTAQKRVRLKPFGFVHPLELLESNPFVRRAINPWVYGQDSKNDFSQSVEPVISKSNGCGYNLHQNSSFLETPWFAQDYVRYAACTLQKLGKLQQKSNR